VRSWRAWVSLRGSGGLLRLGAAAAGGLRGGLGAGLRGLLGIDVLGEYTTDNGSIEVYSRYCQKVVPIPSIDHFSYCKLVQTCGDAAFHYAHEGVDKVDGKKTMKEVRLAIAYKAREVNLSKVGLLGQGIWKAAGEHFVVVNGGQAAVYDRKTHALGRVTNPRLGRNTIIDFSATEPWVDFVELNDLVAKASDPAWAMSVVEDVVAIFRNWNWKHPQDAWTTALLVAQTFIQTTLAWRPEIAITGPSDCGKTTMMTTLTGLFGRLNMYVQKPTEAGLRQHMGNSAKAVLVDEFENDKHRQQILDVFRVTSQGGTIVRGTSDQKGKTFNIRHIPWFAAIESGLTKAADRNRFIILDLEAIPPSKRGRVSLPGPLTLEDMGLKLCAVALRYADAASAIFKTLKGTTFDGVHGRVVESFSVPASLKAAVAGATPEEAVRTLGELLADRTSIGRQGGGDESDLMKAILDSTVPIGAGLPPVSVSVAISDPEVYLAHSGTLESQGVSMTEGRPGPRRPQLEGKKFMFFDMTKVKRFLLRGTDWYGMDCEQLLLRVPGAERRQRIVSRQRIWGIEIPAREWVTPITPEERVESVLPLDIEPDHEELPPEEVAFPASYDAPVSSDGARRAASRAMKDIMDPNF
jgi:energy-coupling factor transporter ATP-binding protein EcfA2